MSQVIYVEYIFLVLIHVTVLGRHPEETRLPLHSILTDNTIRSGHGGCGHRCNVTGILTPLRGYGDTDTTLEKDTGILALLGGYMVTDTALEKDTGILTLLGGYRDTDPAKMIRGYCHRSKDAGILTPFKEY